MRAISGRKRPCDAPLFGLLGGCSSLVVPAAYMPCAVSMGQRDFISRLLLCAGVRRLEGVEVRLKRRNKLPVGCRTLCTSDFGESLIGARASHICKGEWHNCVICAVDMNKRSVEVNYRSGEVKAVFMPFAYLAEDDTGGP